MARQEFLSGGYLGKLGQTVGSRRGSTRFIRTYVVPANPRTPAQQANRQRFARATNLAQQAYNINGGASYWPIGNGGEFPNRVSTAARRLIAGLGDNEALPLYPDGMADPHLIIGTTFAFSVSTSELSITSQSPVFDEPRSLHLTAHIYSRNLAAWEQYDTSVSVLANQTFGAVIPWTADYSYPEGAWIEAATSDDDRHADFAIELERRPVIQPSIPWVYPTLSPEPATWDKQHRQLTIDLNITAGRYNFHPYLAIRTYDATTGAWSIPVYYIDVVAGQSPDLVIPWDAQHSYPEGADIDDHTQSDDDTRVTWEIIGTSFVQPAAP